MALWRVGTIQDFRGSWSSGLAELVIDGQAIPCDNAATVRALDALFGDVIGPGQTVRLQAIRGKRVAYRLDDQGLVLEALAPAGRVDELNQGEGSA